MRGITLKREKGYWNMLWNEKGYLQCVILKIVSVVVTCCFYFVWYRVFVGNSTKKRVPVCACSDISYAALTTTNMGWKRMGKKSLTNWEEIIVSVAWRVDIRWRVLTYAEVGCESQTFHIWEKVGGFWDFVAHVCGICVNGGKIIFGRKKKKLGESVGKPYGTWILSKKITS